MAVTAARAPGAPGAPGARNFVRLKLRLMGNSLRGQTWRVIGFVIGALFGLFTAFVAMLGLSASGTASPEIGYIVAAFAGTAVVLGWTLVPLLFFGVDETLDPARFALLPVPSWTLARGMLAAAFVGVPAVATLLALAGLVVAAAIRFGVVEAVVAGVGVLSGLTVGVVASRAVTSAFASLLRSRRVRDLAAVLIALLATSVGPLQWAVLAAVQYGELDQAVRVADVLGWTPFAAPFLLPFDVGAGRFDLLAAHVAITVGSIAFLLWWWSRTLEGAMLDRSSGASARTGPLRAGPVATLFGLMRMGIRPGPFGAIVARESRFWWRDGRRRAAFVSILMASAVLPIALNVGGQAVPGGLSTVGFGFAITMAGTMSGMLLGNQFGYDGSAYAAHLLSWVPGRTELRARATAIAVVAVPVQLLVVAAVSVLVGRVPQLPAGLGLLAASFGSAIAASSLLSVLAAYPMPENANPFAVNSGAGSTKGLLAIVAMIGTLILAMPVAVMSFLIGESVGWSWALLGIGALYGLVMAWLGTFIAGDLLDRRGPELLTAVTPRR